MDLTDKIVSTMIKSFRCALVLCAAALLCAQTKTPTAAEALKQNFDYVNNKVLTMAEDFPADKYDYKLKPEMRSFGSVIVHIASGNIYAGKAGKGEKVKWDEQDPAKYKSKAECVALLKKSVEEANTALALHPEGPHNNMEPFLSVLQHTSEHYGLLVAYYRTNGLVPPESRPKK
jgi:DinB superfamily